MRGMTDEAALRKSLWRRAAQASVKRLAHTSLGGKILRAAYESYFESRAVTSACSVACTATSRRPQPWRLLASRSVTRATPRRPGICMNGISSSQVTTRSCSGSAGSSPRTKLLFDLGGDVGNRYLAFRKYLTYPEIFIWLVNDIPAVVALGRTIAEEEAAAHLRSPRITRGWREAEILLASGVLQVLEDWNGFLQHAAQLASPPPRSTERLSATNRMAVTLYAIGVSFNPYHIFNRRSFVAAFVDLGYRLVDEWQTPDLGMPDPGSRLTFARCVTADFISFLSVETSARRQLASVTELASSFLSVPAEPETAHNEQHRLR